MTTIVDGQAGITFPDSSAQGTAGYTGFRNRIINGNMVVDQRNAGAAVTPTNTQYLVDRFSFYCSQPSKFTAQQNAGSVTLPAGFTKYQGLTVASAYSVTSTDFFLLSQKVEGFNVADLAWGTASAATVTLSFRVYSSLTGTFGGAIRNGANNRFYLFSYTVSSTNTWTSISVTIAGDTTGTWATDNTTGIEVLWGLGVGPTYSGTAGSWSGTVSLAPTGATSVVGTNGATFYITGVQLEKGSVATPFEFRQFGTELALCQRYYTKLSSNSSYTPFGTGHGVTSTSFRTMFNLPVPMRAAQTVSYGGTFIWAFGNSTTLNALAAWGPTTASMDCTSTGITAFYCYTLTDAGSNNSYIAFSAEL